VGETTIGSSIWIPPVKNVVFVQPNMKFDFVCVLCLCIVQFSM